MEQNRQLQAHWAPVSPVALMQALREHYGLAGTLTRFTSECDETFRLDGAEARYTVKLANPAQDAGALAIQTAVLRHVASHAPSLPVPRVVLTLGGEPCADFGGRVLRVLSWLDGQPLCHHLPDASEARQIGTALARLDQGLASYAGPVPDGPMLWDISRIGDHASLADGVDRRWRDLVLRVLDEAAGDSGPWSGQLIHNDFNPHNLLVAPHQASFVTGIIDFGDIVCAPRINDLAVASAYHLARPDWADVAGALIGGYHAAAPLRAEEQARLPMLIAARLALTLMVTEWRARLHPDNLDYILRNHPGALEGLRVLSALSMADRRAWVARSCGGVA